MSWAEPSCAVITGAASGMGLATARHFLAEGWTVVAVDRAEAALDESGLRSAQTPRPPTWRPTGC